MEYENSVAIIKQVREGFSPLNKSIGGIARIESEGGVDRLFLSVINIALIKEGEYFLFLLDGDGKIFYYSLGIKPTSINFVVEGGNFEKGFCLGIVFIKDCIPEVVAFSRTEGFNATVSDFKKAVALECLKKKTLEEKNAKKSEILFENEINDQTSCSLQENFDENDKKIKAYDDEAVATENYFEFTEEDIMDIKAIAEDSFGRLSNENANAYIECENEKEKIEEDAFCKQFSTSFTDGEKYSKDNPYYLKERGELDLIFSRFPEESSLKKLFPLSRWARINYSEDKFYVVGEIVEDDAPKYICYGVPSSYSKEPPKELEGYCTFIPLSVFEMTGDGFWMMFQDAVTGECVLTPKN